MFMVAWQDALRCPSMTKVQSVLPSPALPVAGSVWALGCSLKTYMQWDSGCHCLIWTVLWACSFSKPLSLLYLTLALVWMGGLGIFAVTGESLYDAFWQVSITYIPHQMPTKHLYICGIHGNL